MRVLIAHNFYQQPGGEDQVFAAECALLKSRGHHVHEYVVHNDDLQHQSRLGMAVGTFWNRRVYRELSRIVRDESIEVAHFHNTFPLMSPAAYYAVRRSGAAVVQTLHNFRLICSAATLFRDGKLCEDCVGKAPWPAIVHGCYRRSRQVTAVTAAMTRVHHAAGTYAQAVDQYIALTEFARGKFVAGGMSANQIVLKPNFVPDNPSPGSGTGGYAVYVGRLAMEKGIEMMLQAWKQLDGRIPLKIIGDGVMRPMVEQAAGEIPGIQWMGRLPMEQVMHHLGEAAMLVFPSIWYEGQPRTMVESFAKGTPIVASNLGSMAEMIDDGRTGRLFWPGDSAALARTVDELWQNPSQLASMRQQARLEYEMHYSADINHQMLMGIYADAIRRRQEDHRTNGSTHPTSLSHEIPSVGSTA
ncbi:MAG: glycosyltransferase family 4 protein [Phycisphaerales bacterium]|jgi:glycosyltransferase involved in cell wall biosynthesis|nr:glycosyltransferase family 4 protein [Phycisphaerales bacterium]